MPVCGAGQYTWDSIVTVLKCRDEKEAGSAIVSGKGGRGGVLGCLHCPPPHPFPVHTKLLCLSLHSPSH